MADATDVHSLFDPFLDINPERYDEIIQELDQARQRMIAKDMTQSGTLITTVEHWEGAAAESFSYNVANPLGGVITNQTDLIKELIVAAAANREIATRAQKDAIAIVLGTEGMLDSLNDPCCDKDTLTKLLGIFGALAAAIAGVGAICALAGAAAATTAQIGAASSSLGLISAVGGGANNFIPSQEAATIKGKTPQEVLDSARDAIDKLKKGIDDQETQLKKTLDSDLDWLKNAPNLTIPDIDMTKCNFEPKPGEGG
ncbi:MAG TPA: hypothetical protein VE172_20105 [Stackebrandtia sp.]|jgi:hypothetical protein|uniref:hypothetical protein n=1 Tax=Stackebrandtia sp. TaxID=2023065 RepID=UPI002D432F46|nr:hypothetical protein [Stackebrandtia sp.]HZE41109.1 hypothetical protein [Stackebrandtia sp.]